MKIFLTLLLFAQLSNVAAQVSEFIHVDQFGYISNAVKVAVLSNPQTGFNSSLSYDAPATMQLRDAGTHEVVFSGPVQLWNNGLEHDQSGDKGWWFDFSAYTTPGSYYIYDPVNVQQSATFEINNNPYLDILKAAGRMFYYNRCNTDKPEEFAGEKWTDGTNFLNPQQDANCRYIYDQDNPALEKDLSGGWFDAGDYNKYVTFTFSALHDLLSAYEENPEAFGDDWNIPESGNGIPDLIDEIKWELDWLMKMLNPDGSCHIKMGSKNYDENTLSPPSINNHPRYYGPTCTSASATIASVFAHASIVFGNFSDLTNYSESLLNQAVTAWNYVMPYYNSNTLHTDCDDGSIVAGDADMTVQKQKDVLLTAAVYLFIITGETDYHNFIINNYDSSSIIASNFWDVNSTELIDAFLRYTELPEADTVVKNNILDSASFNVINNWNNFWGWVDDDLYRAFMPDWSYHWGSNQAKADYANLNNTMAAKGIGDEQSLKLKAMQQLHYFHGVNPLGIVYLSNMYDYGGERCINEIYHTWFQDGSIYDNAIDSPNGPAPGFLVGGPNKDYSGSLVPPSSQPPQKSYKDWNTGWPENSWEISEPSIYAQAAYLRLLANYVVSSHNVVFLPDVTTLPVTDIEANKAVSGGNITFDGGADVLARGLVWNISPNPDLNNHAGMTAEGHGSGTFISELTGLNNNTVYYVRAYATNIIGTAYGNEIEFATMAGSFVCGTTFITDIEGNVYNTVRIGSQCWMKENLRVTKTPEGTDIIRYCSGNNAIYCEQYGGLYSWHTIMNGSSGSNSNPSGVQGICPEGWHLPSNSEWTMLSNNLGGSSVAGGKMKSTRTHPEPHPRWNSPNSGATNSSSFSGLPGGGRDNNGYYYNLGANAYFWTTTQQSANIARLRALFFDSGSLADWHDNKVRGFSVRCLRDHSLSTVLTNSVNNISQTSATIESQVPDDGGVFVTAHGIVWSTAENPTVQNNEGITNDGSGMGTYTSTITGLAPETTYFVRAYATNTVGTAYGNELQFTTSFAGLLFLSDIVIDTDSCFSATETIVVAGDGCNVVINSGTNAELVAGQSIFLKHGTLVEHGAVFQARITTDGTFCDIPVSLVYVSHRQDPVIHQPIIPEEKSETEALFKVYPNPTNGNFTIEFSQFDESSNISIEILSISGSSILNANLVAMSRYDFDMSANPKGLYIIRVHSGQKTGSQKLILK